MSINILKPEVASQIAAGEVVERPSSVVKEMVENSLDASATQINVEIEGGGIDLIRVTDNGFGLSGYELTLAFERHATSKLTSVEDLEGIDTLGFRGEALPSIAAVAEVHLVSRTKNSEAGCEIILKRGQIEQEGPASSPVGTAVSVRNLFAKFPARRKFLKSASAESARVTDLISRLALAFPTVAFRLKVNKKDTLYTPGNGNLLDTISYVYGQQTSNQMLEVKSETADGYKIYGFVSVPSHTRSNRSYITFFIGGRWIQSRVLTIALEEAYHGLLPQRRHPLAITALIVPDQSVDVNIHPAKKEVRFHQENRVFSLVQRSVRATLLELAPVVGINVSTPAIGREGGVPKGKVSEPKFALPATHFEERSTAQSAPTHKDSLPLLRILGQMKQMFIVAEGPDGLYLIDQHAAHERIIFERIYRREESKDGLSQPLLEPIVVEFSAGQKEQVNKNFEALSRYGFILDNFGDSSYLLRAVPAVTDVSKATTILQEVLDLQAQERRLTPGEESLVASIACHSSIRAGMSLENNQMEEMIRQLETTDNPRVCPHGRPTMVHLSSRHLEREFGR